ncbi:hypothetical protein [Thermoleophilum album]|uniref:Uncharacterized protein n=1 Tax=Thermoleophilum album TaxID=29539 RepID=A0A1H6FVD1_THEAL|nr:hypothetical protein [Thermoleophilum album]SEH13784.1 hypothetical protein SAMN02745716_1317 [Thermoleophilum album]
MTTEGWIFLVGFRIFDVGLLILWLIWFFRRRNDDEPGSEGSDGGGGGPPRGPRDPAPSDGGLRLLLPLGRWRQGRARVRSHRPRVRRGGRRALPSPARVRSPRVPLPTRTHH